MTTVLKVLKKDKMKRNIISFAQRMQQTVNNPLPKSNQSEIVPVFRKACNYTDNIALGDAVGTYTYGNIFMGAKELCNEISVNIGRWNSERVLFLCPNDANYVMTQWAIWMSGQIAVPVSPRHPQNLLEYYCNDSNAKLLVTVPEYADVMARVAKNCGKQLILLDDNLRQNMKEKKPTRKSDMEAGLSKDFYNRNNAMILYTSGTTGLPKGVVLSHRNLVCQITMLLDAWKWSQSDVLLHCLPLHHVHGIVNALLCPLYTGAKVIMQPKFDKNDVWGSLLGVNQTAQNRITVFMAVPTIYAKLIEEYEKLFSQDPKMCEYIKQTLKSKVRLMVSGSAPLPVPTFEKWLEISGHRLLERFGMTEIGMCLSNAYSGPREPGYVGLPLPGVYVRVANKIDTTENYQILVEAGNINGQTTIKIVDPSADLIGELHVKGDSVFKEYYNHTEATKKEFTADGWFKTGDVVSYSIDKGLFKMLGRQSVDIIKSGGYKVSAVEVETHLLGHPKIGEAAVFGLDDEKWGEIICAIVVLKEDETLSIKELRDWAKTQMAEYTIPTRLEIVHSLVKNAMGKVNKREYKSKLLEKVAQ